VDDRVAVGVRARHVRDVELVAFTLKTVSRVKVIVGSATRGSALNFMPRNSDLAARRHALPHVLVRHDQRARGAEILVAAGWSKCQCVLSRNFTGFGVSLPIAAWIFGVSGANWSSIISTASSPIDRPMLPPSPVSM